MVYSKKSSSSRHGRQRRTWPFPCETVFVSVGSLLLGHTRRLPRDPSLCGEPSGKGAFQFPEMGTFPIDFPTTTTFYHKDDHLYPFAQIGASSFSSQLSDGGGFFSGVPNILSHGPKTGWPSSSPVNILEESSGPGPSRTGWN